MPEIYTCSLIWVAGFAILGWVYAVMARHYSHVDSMWSLFMLIVAIQTAMMQDSLSARGLFVLIAAGLWSVRLSAYITLRNWGKEDYRYETIRQNNEPYFWLKSIYIVYGFQALLAWLIAYPLYVAVASSVEWQWLDVLAALLFVFGFLYEAIADWQLYQFKGKAENAGRVMNAGLWRYSRHPNYFGESLVWWAFALFALSSGSLMALFSAVLMNLLLLKVSGVALMEKTIPQRKPAYADYMATTNAFIPGKPKKSGMHDA